MSWKHTKGTNYKPASGIEAHGPGWGGEANGAGKGGAHTPQKPVKKRNRGANLADARGAISSENAAEMGARPRNLDQKERDYNRIASREEIHGFWSSVMFDEKENMFYRDVAATKLHAHRYPLDQQDGGGQSDIVIRGGLPDGD